MNDILCIDAFRYKFQSISELKNLNKYLRFFRLIEEFQKMNYFTANTYECILLHFYFNSVRIYGVFLKNLIKHV